VGETIVDATCAISGLRLHIPGLEGVSIPASTGYYHPIFTLDNKVLYKLYYQHTRNKLSPADSYLVFCAFLHATGQVDWQAPATCRPQDARTSRLVQNNLAQLIAVSEKTACIKHPSFKQPSFVVSYDNGSLEQVHNWIEAWQDNLLAFNVSRATYSQQRSLLAVEGALDRKLKEGVPLEELPVVVSSWASQAADFPPAKDEQYQRVIRSCFNSSKMFNTPLLLIREVQEYCFANIEAGSVHFHTLCEILKEGASRHVDYLGGSSLALGYTLLDTKDALNKEGDLKTTAELAAIASRSTPEAPVREDYQDSLSYLKARLSYKVAMTLTNTPEGIDL
jgi:hypothetical protein